MGQVRHHHESTERQYALRNRAVEMMWAPERIRILDQDLGQSGAQTTNREDFKTLVVAQREKLIISAQASTGLVDE